MLTSTFSKGLSFFSVKTPKREQGHVLLILVVVQTFASVYGWIEGEIYPWYPHKDKLQLFGHFSYYHLAMVTLFALAAFSIAIVTIAATASKDWVGLPYGYRIVAVWLVTFIPSIALFFASNRSYLNSLLEAKFKPLIFGR
jgi:hypothetical protein